MDLPERVALYISTQELASPGAGVVLAVSGGPDSLCLLDVLHSLAPALQWALHVAHLDHGLRPESGHDAAFVRQQAESRGLAFFGEAADVSAFADQQRLSVEEAARVLRYRFLAGVARRTGAGVITTAHTADDQAETVLMRLLRGSGLAGLSGMRPDTDAGHWLLAPDRAATAGATPAQEPATAEGESAEAPRLRLIRPLLATTRAEVEAYCARRGLQALHDASNADRRYLRNRLRHDLLPELAQYNPNIRAVLARTAGVLAGEHDLLRRAVDRLWEATLAAEPPDAGQVAFDRARWLALDAPEQRALLRAAVMKLRASLRDADFAPLEAAVRFSRRAAPGRSCDLLAGLALWVSADQLVVGEWAAAQTPGTGAWPQVDDAGQMVGWRFEAQMVPPGAVSGWPYDSQPDRWREYVDARAVTGPLRVRAREAGDRFCPLGLGGHSRKISNFMIDVKLAEPLRARWPLVVCGDDVVWVAGLRLDERFRVTDATSEVMCLSLIPARGAASEAAASDD